MLIHPDFDPVAIRIGPLAIHWYGLMYLASFLAFAWLARLRRRIEPFASLGFSPSIIDDLLFAGVLGVVLGGRLGYVLFYQWSAFITDPLIIVRIWQGGMSFHGGLIGVILAIFWSAYKKNISTLVIADFVAPCIPVALALGRIGNFINGELWGRPSNLPWAMVFPQSNDAIARHPSQLYEFTLEGVLLFIVMWSYARKPRPIGSVTALFLLGYALARFFVEFAREPDRHLGLLWLGLSMGQWLTLPMFLLSFYLWKNTAKNAP